MAVPLKQFRNFWRTFEMPLINWDINLILKLSPNCVITNSKGAESFAITNTKLYVSVITLLNKDIKLLEQLKSNQVFKETIN